MQLALMLLRWFAVDEISMVDATLWHRVDLKFRRAVPDTNPRKFRTNGEVRSHGGLNLILIGDFVQLPPPKGVSLCEVPQILTKFVFTSNANAQAGIELMWLHVTHIVELCIQVRIRDAWYYLATSQCRKGALSDNNWAFIHGEATTVCGSYMKATAEHPDPRTLCGKAEPSSRHQHIKRYQFPITSGQALTIHSSQGGTFDAAILDLEQQTKFGEWMSIYVVCRIRKYLLPAILHILSLIHI